MPAGTRTTAASSGVQADQHILALHRMHPGQGARQHLAPTFAPQPPQRMAMAEIAWSCSSASSVSRSAGRVSGREGMANWVNLRMKRRSIQSFQRQIRSPRAIETAA
jgi:hypothetical protein